MQRVLTACLVVASLMVLVGSVRAEHGEGGSSLSQTADTSICGEVTLSGTNEEHLGDGTPMAFGIAWFTEDGQHGTFSITGSHTVTFEEDVNDGSVWVSYGVSVGAESDWYLPHDTAIVDTDCAAPLAVANAGPDQTLPAESEDGASVQLDGSASTNAETYTWTLPDATTLDGPAPDPVPFAVGTHDVTLTVTNSEGVEATDTVIITIGPFVAPAPPVANAGEDQTVTSTNDTDAEVTLGGTGSTDSDGTITTYSWSENDTEIATEATATVTLPIGTHDITLTVTDDDGLTGTDTVQIIVEEEVVIPPTNLVVTVYCNRNPELTRVDNIGEGTVTIVSVSAQTGGSVETSRPLGPGRTVIFRSDSGATTGTILTTDELYEDGNANEGAIVRISTGEDVAATCVDVDTMPTPPSNLVVTVYCQRNPELTRVENHGAGAVTIVSVTSRSGVMVETSRLLGPGRTVIFRSDSGATSGTILTTQELYDDQFAGEGTVVRVHTGRGFAASCID